MKLDFSGVHIQSIKPETVQRSATQENAIAFMTDDGVWIHMPLNLLSVLSQGAIKIKQAEDASQSSPFV